MKNKIFIISLIFFLYIVLVSGYTADNYTDIESTLKNDYTADNYTNIISIFGSDEIINIAPNKPTLNSPENASTGNPTNVTLNVTVTDDDSDFLNVSFYNGTTEKVMGINSTAPDGTSYYNSNHDMKTAQNFSYNKPIDILSFEFPFELYFYNWTIRTVRDGTILRSGTINKEESDKGWQNYTVSPAFTGNIGTYYTIQLESNGYSFPKTRNGTTGSGDEDDIDVIDGIFSVWGWGTDEWLNSPNADLDFKTYYTNSTYLGNDTNIANSSSATYNWNNLPEGTYNWYATVTDGILTNTSDIWTFTVSEDSCTCPGLNQNWEIDMSDYCNITSNCNLGTGKLSFIGTGETRCNAEITTSDLGDPNANGELIIQSNCLINVK